MNDLLLGYIAAIAMASFLVGVIVILIRKRKEVQRIDLRDALLTVEELETHAKRTALEHDVGKSRNLLSFPIQRLNDNYSYITTVYKSLNEDIQQQRSVSPAAEWLLDNFYIIEEQVKNLRLGFNMEDYRRLPILKSGLMKGNTRVYAIATELVSHSDGQIEEEMLLKYLKAYQSHNILFNREILMIPTMMRLALIENVRMIAQRIKSTRSQWQLADDIVDEFWMGDKERSDVMIQQLKNKHDILQDDNPSFIEHLFYRLRRSGKSYFHVLKFIDENLDKYDTTTEKIAQKEHNIQALSTVAIGNSILSLKYIATHNWTNVFDEASFVENILKQDPLNIYASMDEKSRNHYRIQVEKLAKIYGVSELHIAREAVQLAQNGLTLPDDDPLKPRKCHVGYYLIAQGITQLEQRQKGKVRQQTKILRILNTRPGTFYILFNGVLTLLLITIALLYANMYTKSYWIPMMLLTMFAVAIPASEIAISIVNWIVVKIQKPAVFVRLDLLDGIPVDMKTIVVIPAILSDEKRVAQLIATMENHYIANSEENLYFALIGAFKDFGEADADDDLKILKATFDGITALNKTYASNSKEIFYFYHRVRKYNPTDGNWTGWERKRGALMEFNDILLGNTDTSFTFYSNITLPAKDIRYVITLDADTVLPMGMAKNMIATMAHPLNVPIIDSNRGIVSEGYGLMQPRVSFDVDSSNRSVFARVYTGQEGIDPYASAISDVYQDLFGEGIFTGKGIYDLHTFQAVLKDAIPVNAVLSHDLLEGSYVRAALVNDLELVDSYPSKYNAYIARMYRWIRGDWQLLPWLGRKPYNRNNEKTKNALSSLSKWKIIDNLRRSLVSSAIMVLLFLGFSILPGVSLFYVLFAGLTLSIPLLLALIDRIKTGTILQLPMRRHIAGFFGLKASVSQIVLRFIFLAYQSHIALSAICVTLTRVLVTKKNMLEWVTSADAEKNQDNSLKSYLRSIFPSTLYGVALALLAFRFKPESLPLSLAILLVWTFAPFMAYWISRDNIIETPRLTETDSLELRKTARRTWRYFEEFANIKNNGLAPDNYQEDPPRGIAYRTSPTDIGFGLLANVTARDFGYITTEQLFEHVNFTVKTLERMDKWQGHLYNWYDTRTLKPLEPLYVSTVDNGNYVAYLMTLIQGLEDSLRKPLVDLARLDGIRDTLLCGLEEGDAQNINQQVIDDVYDGSNIELDRWNRGLRRIAEGDLTALINKQPWRFKFIKMIQDDRKEIQTYMAWLGLLEDIPSVFSEDSSDNEFKTLVMMLKQAPRLDHIDEFFKSIYDQIKLLHAKQVERDETSDRWLGELKVALMLSQSNSHTLITSMRQLITRIQRLSWETKFDVLYDPRKQLFSIGYDVAHQKLTNSYYDLLASESRQTSFIAIARGEVPSKHWSMLGRSLTVVNRYKGLVSWSGTMFEYLMPLLIMKNYRNTLLDETYSFVIKSQIKYGKQRKMPWGTSESGFNVLDLHMDYQYKAIGVPWLGLKRGLIDDAVCAPYASFLALMVDPVSAMKNIRELKTEGIEGAYGYYEAVDYTPERLGYQPKRAIIKSYMAHHQGMSLVAISNILHDNVMQKRFHLDPYVKAATLLLQEKVPLNVVITKETKEKITSSKELVYHEKISIRKFNRPNFDLPNAHILSNGLYSVMLTDKGTGYSKNKLASITRYREDPLQDSSGMFFYVKNLSTGKIWSSAYAPLNITPESYEVAFSPDKASFRRVDDHIETLTEVVVTTGDHAEIRRLILTNRSDIAVEIEVTSYLEVILASAKADLAHRAFSNLFVETEYDAQNRSLFANRRPRSSLENRLWTSNTLATDAPLIEALQIETDRMAFIGRDRNLSSPQALLKGKPLTQTVGPVLDPIFSMRAKIKIEPGAIAKLYFVTTLAQSKENLLTLIEKYRYTENCENAFWLALTRSQMENKYLNIKADALQLYQEMISHLLYLSPLRRSLDNAIQTNHKGQPDLWPYGISGDHPIVLVTLSRAEETPILYEILKAHEYWRTVDLDVDIVIIVNEDISYMDPLATLITDIVQSRQTRDAQNRQKDIFILNARTMADHDVTLLTAVARIVLVGGGETMEEQMSHIEAKPLSKKRQVSIPTDATVEDPVFPMPELLHFNGLGGFSPDGNTYVIRLENDQQTPAPWANIVANPKFGFLTTESGGGYTWANNSRENKLTPFSNDPVSDPLGEVIYLNDENDAIWTITPQPIRESTPYMITHGFGYSRFNHRSHGIDATLTQFVPLHEPVKINQIVLTNHSVGTRNITLTYYMKPVLGVESTETGMHIVTRRNEDGCLLLENHYATDFKGKIAFIDASIEPRTVTGNRAEFFWDAPMDRPDCLFESDLSDTVGAGYDPCGAMQVKVILEPGETKRLVFLLGMEDSDAEIRRLSSIYRDMENVDKTFDQVNRFWKQKLNILQVKTPDSATDLMLNGWLQYQTLACRLWARTGFYQSGGAFGFRDQLQDILALAVTWPSLAKEQILKHASHQFVEGDVQHWWHEPQNKGTRTRISDDLLWLPYVTAEYIRITGDHSILDFEVPFVSTEVLNEFEEERYCQPTVTAEVASLRDHCERAIAFASKFGEHGLPLIQTGDWNDGMNTVGNKGKGESVWLAWFMSDTLRKFSINCYAEDTPNHSAYLAQSERILAAIEEHAWDGEWYKRAYFDDGNAMGSAKNRECKIDSISQSWSVIAGGKDTSRTKSAMESMENYLIIRNQGVMKLLTPPFDDHESDPGYIKGYLPGVRENGGQYTHAAVWAIIAFAKMGESDKAWELFDLINPINHTRNLREYSTYKVEPYVLAADVYSEYPHSGRGGWSWYTGSAGWMYRCGIENILGFEKNGTTLTIHPNAPRRWKEYEIIYQYLDTTYQITILNPTESNRKTCRSTLDGVDQAGMTFDLMDDGNIHQIIIECF